MDWLMGLAAAGGGDLVQMPWGALATLLGAVAALVLAAAKVVEKVQGKRDEKPTGTASAEALAPVLADLTKAMRDVAEAYGRFTGVLERMEATNEKNQEAVAATLAELNKAIVALDKVLSNLDYRTREIRDDVKGLPAATKEIVANEVKAAVAEIKAAMDKAEKERRQLQ